MAMRHSSQRLNGFIHLLAQSLSKGDEDHAYIYHGYGQSLPLSLLETVGEALSRPASIIGPIAWGHSGPLCHALSLLSMLS